MAQINRSLHRQINLRSLLFSLACAFVLLPCVARTSALPVGRRSDETAPKLSITPDLNADSKTDVDAMDKYEAAVRDLLNQGKFETLDQMASSLRSEKARFAGGTWKLYVFYRGLKWPQGGYKASDTDWDAHLEKLAEWAGENPNSVTALIALAEANFEYAEKGRADADAARAPGAEKVEGDSWEQINSRVHAAKLSLQAAEKLPAKCPHYYFVKQKVYRKPNAVLLQEAIAFEPTYYYYYRLQALLLHLDSDADPDAAEKFADEVSTRIGGPQGAIIYYEIAATLNGSVSSHLWPKAKLSWAKVQQGYAALEKEYGTSVFKANQMALLAVRARDMETAERMLTVVGDRWTPEIWGTHDSFATAKVWASAPTDVAIALRTAVADQETSEGERYVKSAWDQFRQNYGSVIRGCYQQSGQDTGGDFDLLVQLSGEGVVKEIKAWPQTKLGTCMMPLLAKAKFTNPPRGLFWLNLPFHRQEP